ncbi:MATE family efflux transporter [Hungatella hathewayi]
MRSGTGRVGRDLTNGSIFKLLITFAIPIMLTGMIQQLYSIVDLMIIGQYVGSVGTVAVSTGGELADFVTPVASAFAMAGQIYIAQLAGASEHDKLKKAAGTLITMMLAMSLFFAVFTFLFRIQILHMLNCPEEAFSEATSYMLITAIGMPFIFGYNAVCGLLRGMGESQRPLLFVAVAATVNVVLDILLVAVFHMGAAGTAIATVCSQMGSFLAAYLFMYHRREQFDFKLSLSYFTVDRESMRIILTLGIPQLVRSIAVHGSMIWVKANINSYGLIYSSTYSIGNKIEKFVLLFSQGVTSASGAMIGQNLGAKKQDRVRKTLLTTLCVTLSIAFIGICLFLTIPHQLYLLFTIDETVADYGITFLRIMCVGCVVTTVAGTFKALATGSGAVKLCFMMGIMDGVCRILVSLLFLYIFNQGPNSFYWGAALCEFIPFLMCFTYFISGKWKTQKLLSER